MTLRHFPCRTSERDCVVSTARFLPTNRRIGASRVSAYDVATPVIAAASTRTTETPR